MSRLYVVATPIGNLGDITFRAIETLKAVSLVACEDTRRTLKLLTHFDIHVKMISVRSANEKTAACKVVAALREGQDAAYVSDAGTPALSDPGAALVRAVTDAGFEAVPIPGVSAFTSLLSVAGALDKTVVFEGFLSPKASRRKRRVGELMAGNAGFVVYESPFRIFKLLENIADFDRARYVCVGREMTKLHEEFIRGDVETVRRKLGQAGEPRGEFAVYVSGFVSDFASGKTEKPAQ